MNPILDKVDVTDPGKVSNRQFGISSNVPLAGGAWVVDHSAGGTVESVATHAAVNEPGYRVIARPSRWNFERTDGGFIVSDRLTGIFGFGAEPIDAIHDLIAALAEHRDVLERQQALSPGLQDQLAYLRELL